MTRRPHGTGSVFYRESRGRWEGTYEAGYTKTGARRRRTVTGKTKTEAKQKLVAAIQAAAAAEAPTVGGRPTVKRWADQWLENTTHELRPGTWNANRSLINNWIIPTIGQRRLVDLNPGHVREVRNAILRAGLATSTAARAHAVLLWMLKDAVGEGHSVPNGVLLVDGPGAGESDRADIPLDDALALLAAAAQLPDASRWVSAFLQGTRPAETLGLTWHLCDFKERLIDISWQLKPLPYVVARDRSSGFRVPTGFVAKQLHGQMHLVRPKTESGKRIIPMVDWMASALEAWRDIAPASPYDLVWPRADGKPQTDRADREAWRSLQDTAQVACVDGTLGRRYDLYEARHTTATLLRELGVDDESITAILGHSTILSSRAYIHVNNTRVRAALSDLAVRLRLDSPG